MCIHKMYGNQTTDCVKKNQTGNEVGLLWANFVCIHFIDMLLRPSSGQNPCFEAVWVNAKTGRAGAGGRALWGSHDCDATEVYRFFWYQGDTLGVCRFKEDDLAVRKHLKAGNQTTHPNLCALAWDTSQFHGQHLEVFVGGLPDRAEEREAFQQQNESEWYKITITHVCHVVCKQFAHFSSFQVERHFGKRTTQCQICHCNLFCPLSTVFAARYGHIVHCNVCPPKVLAWKKFKPKQCRQFLSDMTHLRQNHVVLPRMPTKTNLRQNLRFQTCIILPWLGMAIFNCCCWWLVHTW